MRRKRILVLIGIVGVSVVWLLGAALRSFRFENRRAIEQRLRVVQFDQAFKRVHKGMRAEEVRALLGTPNEVKSMSASPQIVAAIQGLRQSGALGTLPSTSAPSQNLHGNDRASEAQSSEVEETWFWGFVWRDCSFFQCVPGVNRLLRPAKTHFHGGAVGFDRDGLAQELAAKDLAR